MKSVIFLTGNRLGDTEPFIKRLKQRGLSVVEVAVEKKVRNNRASLFDETRYSCDNTLLITDTPDVADYYLSRNYAVVGYEVPCEFSGKDGKPTQVNEGKDGDRFSGVQYLFEGFDEVDEEYLTRIFKRLKNKPWKICETKRCIIREITVADVERLYEIYAEPSITTYMENLFDEPEDEREYTRQYIRNIYRLYEYGMWIVEEKKSGKIIGRAGLEQNEGMEGLELGYVIAVPYQRKGYAYEVCSAIIKYAWENLETEVITSAIQEGNEASERLCLKLGFQLSETFCKEGVTYHKYKCDK